MLMTAFINRIPIQLDGLKISPEQLDTIMSLVSIAENGNIFWWTHYDYCENIHDKRGLTCMFFGACSGTGDLLMVFQELKKINPNHGLVKYIPVLIKVNGTDSEQGLQGLATDIKKYCDTDYQLAQWNICYKLYWKPVIDFSNKNKITNAITIGELYDTCINFGNISTITSRVKSPLPINGGNESKWLAEFLDVKQYWITVVDKSLNSGQPDRCILWRNIIDNVNLTRPINNLVCYGGKFSLPAFTNTTPVSTKPKPSLSVTVLSRTDEIYILLRIIYGQNPRTGISNIKNILNKKFSNQEIFAVYDNINAHIIWLNENIKTDIKPFFNIRKTVGVTWSSNLEKILSFGILLYNMISDKISYKDSGILWDHFLKKYAVTNYINDANIIVNTYIKGLINTRASFYSNSALLVIDKIPQEPSKVWGTPSYSEKFTSLNGWYIRDNFNKTRFKDNVVVNSAGLHLVTKKNTVYPEKKWSSGYIYSKQKFGYGYFECKMRYAKAKGTNNAFWLTSDMYSWKDSNRLDEIDINEGHSLNVLTMTLHQWLNNYDINKDTTKSIHTYNEDLSLDYHTYGFNYTPTVLEWYLDGNLIKTFDNTNPETQIINQKVKIIFSTAIIHEAGVIGDVENTSMDVEWCRYYQFKE